MSTQQAPVTVAADAPWQAGDARSAGVARNTLYSLVGIVALGGTRLLYNVIIGRAAGPAALGRVGSAVSVAMLASLCFASGTGAAATKFVPAALGRDDPDAAATVLGRLARWTAAGTVAAGVALVLLRRAVLPGSTTTELVLVVALVAAYGAYTFGKGALYGLGQVRRYVVLEFGADTLTLGCAVAVVLTGRTLLLLPLVAGYGAFTVGTWAARHRGPGRRGGRRAGATGRRTDPVGQVAGFVGLAVVGALASTGALQLSMVFARRYGTPLQAGYYAAALSLVTPMYFLPRALSMALFPAMARAFVRRETDVIREHLGAATRLLAFGMLPLFVAAAYLTGPVLHVVYGHRYGAATTVLVLLLAATYVSVVPIPAVNSLSAAEQRYVSVPVAASVAGLAFCVGWWVAFAGHGAVAQVALGYLLGSLIQTLVPMAVAWRKYDLDWRRSSARVLVLCAVACGGYALLRWAGGSALLAVALSLVFGGLVAVASPEVRELAERARLLRRTVRQRPR